MDKYRDMERIMEARLALEKLFFLAAGDLRVQPLHELPAFELWAIVADMLPEPFGGDI